MQCMEPLSDLVVAIGCEGGRVLILKLLGQFSENDHSQMAQIISPTGTAHDDKKQIVKVWSEFRFLYTCTVQSGAA